MWMKNTFIPLDMLFLDKNGFITHLVKETRPLSLEIISSMKCFRRAGIMRYIRKVRDHIGNE